MNRKEVLFALGITLFLAFIVSPFASSSPDGLERVAEDKGFLERGEIEPTFVSPIPDYAWPGVRNEALATSLAGVFGTLVVFGLGYGLAALYRREKV